MSEFLKKKWLISVFLILVQSCLPVASALSGETELHRNPARRIISLAPHITELLFAVGAGAHVIATVEHSDYPKKAKLLPRIGNYQSLDYEKILAMKPDLVLSWSTGTSASTQEKIRSMGIRVVETGSAGLQDISTQLRFLARLAGVEDRGEEVASHFEKLLNELQQQYANRSEVRVFFQIWNRPLMTINGQHFINDVIQLCGGKNIFSGLDSLVPSVSREAVIVGNPEAIFVNGQGEQYQQWLNAWKKWPQVEAVKQGHLYQIKSHTIARPTGRILMGIKKVCQSLEAVRELKN